MVQNTLSQEQKRAFEALNAKGLERRAMYFVRAKRDGAIIKTGDIREQEYYYGGLLWKIYGWGRRAYEDKPLISCILASFTSEMVRENINYRYHPYPEKREKYRRRLVQFLGNSFGNKWTGKAFPRVRIAVNSGSEEEVFRKLGAMADMDGEKAVAQEPVRYGYAADAEGGGLEIQIDLEELLNSLEDLERSAALEDIRKPEVLQKCIQRMKEWLEKEKVVDTLECIDMFFCTRKGLSFNGLNYIFQKADRKERGGEKAGEAKTQNRVVAIRADNQKITLDLMAFVVKSLDYGGERNVCRKISVRA